MSVGAGVAAFRQSLRSCCTGTADGAILGTFSRRYVRSDEQVTLLCLRSQSWMGGLWRAAENVAMALDDVREPLRSKQPDGRTLLHPSRLALALPCC